jgi:hypothetical protein
MSQLDGASYRVRFPNVYLAEASLVATDLRPVLEARIQELLAREHVIVRRRSEGQTREFDARPSIDTLAVCDDEGSTALDAHLRFAVRAQARPDELVALLIPAADPRTLDIERVMLWKRDGGRRQDPLALLSANH